MDFVTTTSVPHLRITGIHTIIGTVEIESNMLVTARTIGTVKHVHIMIYFNVLVIDSLFFGAGG